MSEAVAREILHDIVDRGLQPGAMLPSEAEMLRTLRAGRASLREGLRILETQGLITIKPGPGGGPVVAGTHSGDFGRMATAYFHASGATFRELIEARLVMEPVMARQAAERQDTTLIEELQTAVEQSRTVPVDDDQAYLQSATGFHDLVAGMSGNRILDLIGRALKDVYIYRVRELHFPPDERERILKMHESVAKAIVRGAAASAERRMREHMEEFVEVAERRFPGILEEVVEWR